MLLYRQLSAKMTMFPTEEISSLSLIEFDIKDRSTAW